ncbi:MAG: hypothetical protein KDA69_10330 [Planctomycetaceae bacterium]|nr:hypothetical protein [Planctomycetaceae bacterium]
MTNGNWACFNCRITVRRPTWRQVAYFRPWVIGSKGDGQVKCPECKEACNFLGPKIAVPPKRDKAGWEKLRSLVMEAKLYWHDRIRRQKAERKHQIERQIQELIHRPENEGRKRFIESLRKELEELTQ